MNAALSSFGYILNLTDISTARVTESAIFYKSSSAIKYKRGRRCHKLLL